jgi:hypothetical protein
MNTCRLCGEELNPDRTSCINHIMIVHPDKYSPMRTDLSLFDQYIQKGTGSTFPKRPKPHPIPPSEDESLPGVYPSNSTQNLSPRIQSVYGIQTSQNLRIHSQENSINED